MKARMKSAGPSGPADTVAVMNPAELLRIELQDHRARGVGFPHAWSKALATIAAAEPAATAIVARREHRAWLAALAETRSAWRRAYQGEPAAPAELAVSALPGVLVDALADVSDGPKERRVLVA